MCLIVLLLTKQLSDEATIMSSVSEVNVDIKDFLMSINLEQYVSHFRECGFNTVQDCAAIDDSVLHRIGIAPTGHRRRVIKQLQIILSKMQDIPIYANIHKIKKNGETSKGHPAPSSGQDTCVELPDSSSVQTPSPAQSETVTKNLHPSVSGVENSQRLQSEDELPFSKHSFPIPEEGHHLKLGSFQDPLLGSENVQIESLITKGTVDCTTKEQQTERVDLNSEDVNKLPNVDPDRLPSLGCSISEANPGHGTNGLLERSPPSPLFNFQGQMVPNDLYVPSSPFLTPMRSRSKLVSRPSRSFLLRHRPVPEIPGSTKGISGG